MSQEFFPHIIPASLEDYPTIQNMVRFYVYDLSRDCGFSSEDWGLPAEGLYESLDFKSYFQDPTRRAYLIKVKDELAGFVLLNNVTASPEREWNMGEFFILAKFQRKGIGMQVANQIWKMHPGLWEVSILPENKRALAFWRKIISDLTNGNYLEEMKDIAFDVHRPKRRLLSFEAKEGLSPTSLDALVIRQAVADDIPAMVELSYRKRREYEKAQPQFWQYVENAEDFQGQWFKDLLAKDDHRLLVAQSKDKIKGFVMGRLIPAPEVYNPGGLTLMIDDFCVESSSQWKEVGGALLVDLKQWAKARNAVQTLIVCGAHDEAKRAFLKDIGLHVASEWHVGGIV
jgi:predicted acetyltransferase